MHRAEKLVGAGGEVVVMVVEQVRVEVEVVLEEVLVGREDQLAVAVAERLDEEDDAAAVALVLPVVAVAAVAVAVAVVPF